MNRLYKAFILPSLPMSTGYYGVVDLDSCVFAYRYTYPLSNEDDIEVIHISYSGGVSVNVLCHKEIAKELGL